MSRGELNVLLHEDVVVLGIQGVEHAVDVPDGHHRPVHHDPVRRLRSANPTDDETHTESMEEIETKNQRRTSHRSSRVLRGDPSSAVFRASNGFDLPNAAQKGSGASRSGGERVGRGEKGKGLAA